MTDWDASTWNKLTFTIDFDGVKNQPYWLVGRRTDYGQNNLRWSFSSEDGNFYAAPYQLGRRTSGSWGSAGSDDIMGTLTTTEVTADEITDPADSATLTSIPFDISGTCDSGSHIFAKVFIYDDTVNVGSGSALCSMDAWTISDATDSLYNGDYDVVLFMDDESVPSDSITITVNVTDNPNPPPPDTTPDIACDTGQPIADALCDVLTWLFVPSAGALNEISDLWETVKAKPPIGYFTVAADAFDSLSTGTSSIELEGTAELSDWFDPIKDTITGVLWLLTGFYTVKRIATLDI